MVLIITKMEFRANANKQNYRLCFANFDLSWPRKPDGIIFRDSEQYENIPTLFIEHSRRLKDQGYIKVGFGPDGGYSLARPLNLISLYDIIIHYGGNGHHLTLSDSGKPL